ncbi:MAG: helix-turn-helix domain-containing protein [Lachnospiraceae bacterium]|nr:helix-turn-helix domain-containing protein [Lachnospiraceae bacterium]
MIIPVKQIQNIVEELKDTIQKDINFMDENGCIIASSDSSRIGTYHFGAQQVIRQKLDELVISEKDNYAGSKSGINLPIIIEGEIVGVVGITGENEDVQTLGKVIQKMTKILILNHYQSNQKKAKETMVNNFIFSWLYESEEENESDENISLRGRLLGIDINLTRVVTVMNIESQAEGKEFYGTETEQKCYDRIRKELRKFSGDDSQHLISQIGNRPVIFFHSSEPQKVAAFAKEMAESIEKHYNVRIYCGIGTVGRNRAEIRRSYRESNTACNLAMRMKNKRVKMYSDADLDLLLQNIPKHDRDLFVKRLFKNCEDSEITKWLQLLRWYVENDGSISKTAECCYIHKNTLQYRLSKLKEMTGYDPRNIKESLPLCIAMLIWEMDYDQ